jgi:hypothetical protein
VYVRIWRGRAIGLMKDSTVALHGFSNLPCR